MNPARCPGHTIQFLNYGYRDYIRRVWEELEIEPLRIDWKRYETWTPY
jgi:hypothetical protein